MINTTRRTALTASVAMLITAALPLTVSAEYLNPYPKPMPKADRERGLLLRGALIKNQFTAIEATGFHLFEVPP